MLRLLALFVVQLVHTVAFVASVVGYLFAVLGAIGFAAVWLLSGEFPKTLVPLYFVGFLLAAYVVLGVSTAVRELLRKRPAVRKDADEPFFDPREPGVTTPVQFRLSLPRKYH